MILAVDIGGTRFRVAVSDRDGRIVRVVRRETDRDGGADWMVAEVTALAEEMAADHEVNAVGIGFGGPVDFANRRVINSTHVKGWDDVPLAGVLSDAVGVPAVVDNDANVGALGEYAFGAGRGAHSLVYYTVSTGVGGGIVIEGRVHRGANGNAGELGHVPILADGPLCACGNLGCLEALCSGPAIAARARKAGVRGGTSLTAKDVFDLARDGHRKAMRVVGETADYLGMGIAAAINTIAPECVVIGGGVSGAGKTLLDPLRASVSRRVMPVHRPNVRILRAKRGDNAVLLGAVAMARDLL